jgi:hypothetical protein
VAMNQRGGDAVEMDVGEGRESTTGGVGHDGGEVR